MDELAYSLNGENMHYGTPTNPACPDRIPGGSSSGSAVATADGDVDFALGSDTGGGSLRPHLLQKQNEGLPSACRNYILVPIGSASAGGTGTEALCLGANRELWGQGA